jgi:hypothetical protein
MAGFKTLGGQTVLWCAREGRSLTYGVQVFGAAVRENVHAATERDGEMRADHSAYLISQLKTPIATIQPPRELFAFNPTRCLPWQL